MKNIFLAFCLLVSIDTIAQKTVKQPAFAATNVGYMQIEKILLSDTATVLYFNVPVGSHFRIDSKSYILEGGSTEKLLLKWAKDIQLDKYVKFKKNSKTDSVSTFSLGFPAISKSTVKIDFIESDCERCFKILDISLKEAKKALINVAFRGNWYRTDGSKELVLAIYDSIAVYQNQVWKYTFQNSKTKKATLNLQRPGAVKTLFIKEGKNEIYNFFEEKSKILLLSKNNTGKLDEKLDSDYTASSLFKTDSAVFSGYLGAYSPGLGYKTGQVYVDNNITGAQESYLITILPDGSFKVKFPMHYPQQVYVRFPEMPFSVYCEPGKETFVYVDMAKPKVFRSFMGDCALINEELLRIDRVNDFDYNKMLTDIHGFSPAQYQQYVIENGEKQLAVLKEYQQKNALSKKTYSFMEMDIKFRTGERLFNYNNYIESAYRKANKVPSNEKGPMMKPAVLDSTYYEYIRQLPMNNEIAFLTPSYNSLVNRLRFADIARTDQERFQFPEIFEGLRKTGTNFSAEDEEIIKLVLESQKVVIKDSVAAKKRSEEVQQRTKPFFAKYNDAVNSFVRDSYDENKYARLRSVFQMKDGLMMDLIYAQDKTGSMKRSFKPLSDSELEKLKTKISTPYITSAVIKLNDEVKARVEANKNKPLLANETPKTTADKLFNTIMEKYKGKVVYVDFWATWCGPCINGIQRIASLKEEMKNEDVVFVYITGPSSPFETYKNMIPDIKGEHYRVSKDEWNYLTSKFKITGIPHYVLVDKKGEIADPDLPHLQNTEIKTKIMALSKSL